MAGSGTASRFFARLAAACAAALGVVRVVPVRGGQADELRIVGIEATAPGLILSVCLPLTFSNRLDVYRATPGDYAPWRLTASGVSPTVSGRFVWCDTGAVSAVSAWYAVGDADTDTDADGLADARELFLYGTSSGQADTDADGLTDYAELMQLGTDPNNGDTIRPAVRFSRPAAGTRSVWFP